MLICVYSVLSVKTSRPSTCYTHTTLIRNNAQPNYWMKEKKPTEIRWRENELTLKIVSVIFSNKFQVRRTFVFMLLFFVIFLYGRFISCVTVWKTFLFWHSSHQHFHFHPTGLQIVKWKPIFTNLSPSSNHLVLTFDYFRQTGKQFACSSTLWWVIQTFLILMDGSNLAGTLQRPFLLPTVNSHSLQNVRYQTERFDGIINYTLCWSYQDWLPCLEYNHIIREDHKNFLDSIVT